MKAKFSGRLIATHRAVQVRSELIALGDPDLTVINVPWGLSEGKGRTQELNRCRASAPSTLNQASWLGDSALSSAERLAHPLVRLRWIHVAPERGLVIERLCEHQQKLLERREVRALDLFCGAGGASVGLHRAGFEEVTAAAPAHMPQEMMSPFPQSFIALGAPVRS